MKKLLAILVLIIVVVVVFFALRSPDQGSDNQTTPATQSDEGAGDQTATVIDPDTGAKIDGVAMDELDLDELDEDDDLFLFDERPATDIYSNPEDALKALKQGAPEYDDLILEQFVDLGPDCAWCDDLYKSVTEIMMDESTDPDERSYYAEVLAISGRVGNLRTLVQGMVKAGESEDADIYAEALEMTVGGDGVVNYLNEHMNSDNELLQESVVAAITNQGSRLAAEVLYKHTLALGDADGYYSIGIGLGELVPEPETLPYLQELVVKRDDYSHLALKALLNSGLDGLQITFDLLTNSKDPEADKKMLKDAVDHVAYEEEIERYLKKVLDTSKEPLVTDFAKEILDDFSLDLEDEDLLGDE